MRKTVLGRTGLEISEIALGAGVTGGILIEADEATRAAAIERAIAAGINWIDTAALYGNGASEANIGQHLAALSPRPHISTKVRIEADQMGDIAGAIERSLEQSLKRLRVERVALFQLHNQLGAASGGRPTLTPQQVLARGGVADTFDRLKQQGLFQACGITAVGDPKACLEVMESGRFDTAQVYYNAINPSAAWERAPAGWKAQDFAGFMTVGQKQNMGILNIRVWAGGVLATPKPPQRLSVLTAGTDVENEIRCAAAVRAALGDAYGTPAQAALRFVLGNRQISSRIIGISELVFLDEALAAVPMGPLPPVGISKLERLWRNDFRAN